VRQLHHSYVFMRSILSAPIALVLLVHYFGGRCRANLLPVGDYERAIVQW